MAALRFDRPAGDSRATRIGRVAVPEPGPGEVLIRVSHAGVNFTDVMSRRGDAGYVDRWPFTPGLEAAGTIVAVGADVGDRQPGDVVSALTNRGALAEYVLARAELTAAVPAGLDLAQAAAAPGALTTAALLIDVYGRVHDLDVVLVHSAAGAVGSAVAAMVRHHAGVTLIGTVGGPSRVPAALAAGYDHVVVRGPGLAEDITTYVNATGDELDGRRVDIVLDPQGTDQLDVDLAVLAPGGRIIIFGNAAGGDFDGLPALSRLIGANAAIGGFSLAALSASHPAVIAQALTSVLQHLDRGELHVELIELRGLDEVPDAQQALATGSGDTKYVARITPITG